MATPLHHRNSFLQRVRRAAAHTLGAPSPANLSDFSIPHVKRRLSWLQPHHASIHMKASQATSVHRPLVSRTFSDGRGRGIVRLLSVLPRQLISCEASLGPATLPQAQAPPESSPTRSDERSLPP